jgi:HlyD family secretion protein
MNAPLPPPAVPGGKNKNGASTRRWTRLLPWLGGALLIALIGIGLWPKALPAEVAAVTRGDLSVTVNEEGMTRVKNRYVIAAPVAGQLRRIEWKPGAPVEAGKTVLAVLESGGADLLDTRSLAQAEARVRAGEAAVAQAAALQARAGANAKMQREDYGRQKTLFTSGALSRQEIDGAEMRSLATAQEERAAEFAGQIAEFELAQARALLSHGRRAARQAEATSLSPSPRR